MNPPIGAGEPVDIIDSLAAARALEPEAGRRFYSAQHQEIASGATSDIYFTKTADILKGEGRWHTLVAAEVFTSRAGVMAGTGEIRSLLQDRGAHVSALPEGESFAAGEVVMHLRGPYSAFCIFETAILGILASSCGWAARAREVKEAAGELPVLCFGARHVHPAVAPVMERAALVGGVDGASCILGARLMGGQPSGTVPHALFLVLGDTVAGAAAYHRIMPDGEPRTILVDTFKDEAEESLRVAGALGVELDGVRLDTPSERGRVTPALVREVRARLDQAGHGDVSIFVSGGLDPERIRFLAAAGADGFGVGSYISGAPPLNMTLDIKEVEGRALAKRGRIPGLRPNERLETLMTAERG